MVQAWGVRETLAAFDADERVRSIRADGRQNLRAYLRELLLHTDWQVQDWRRGQMLVSVRQETLVTNMGLTDRTVRRHHRRLEALGYVATVVEGTTPAFRPMALRKRLKARSKANDAVDPAEGNTVPVYVLMLPVSLLHAVPGGPELLARMIEEQDAARDEPGEVLHAVVEAPAPETARRGGLHAVSHEDTQALATLFNTVDQADQSVFTNVRPSPGSLGRLVISPAGARTRGNPNVAPLRGQPFGHGPGGRDVHGAPRRGLWTKVQGRQIFPGDRHPTTKAERLLAADELRRRVITLQQASAHAIRSTIREFLLAGWTVTDLVHAIEWMPDGTGHTMNSIPWATDTGPAGDHEKRGRRATGWLAHRLSAWRDDSWTVMRSQRERDEAERAHRQAARRAADERTARETTRRAEAGYTATLSRSAAAAREIARTAVERGTRAQPAPARTLQPVRTEQPRQSAIRPSRHTSTAEAIRRARERAATGRASEDA